MKKYNWGILGTGWIAAKMAEAMPFVTNGNLYAVGSREKKKADEFAAKYSVSKAYGSYEELVSDTDIDIIYIATPHNLHYENTLLALEHGKNVLCEKPLAVNGREVRHMIATAKEKQLFLMEALWSRFLPNVIEAKRLVDSGAIGKVTLLNADFGRNIPFDPNHRIFNKELIGGSLLDLGIYPLFLSLFILGRPESIIATGSFAPTNVDSICSINLKYTDNCMALIWSSSIAESDVVATIYGEKGKIVFDKLWFTPVPIHLFDNSGKEIPVKLEMNGNGYNYEAVEVGNCLNANKKQSDLMSWADSLFLTDIMDEVRRQIGLVYPGHD